MNIPHYTSSEKGLRLLDIENWKTESCHSNNTMREIQNLMNTAHSTLHLEGKFKYQCSGNSSESLHQLKIIK